MSPDAPANPPDPRYQLVYQASVDLLAVQRATLDNLRSRTTNLLSAMTVATTLAAGLGLIGQSTKTLPGWTVDVAIVAALAVGAAAFYILLPHDLRFGLNAEDAIDHYIESDKDKLDIDALNRELAIWMARASVTNERRLRWLLGVFTVGVVALSVETGAVFIGLVVR